MRYKEYLNESASLTTTLQESLHCVGLGISQMTNSNLTQQMLLNGELFTSAFDKYCKVDIGVNDIFEFAQTNPSWVTSVVNNVNALRQSGWLKGNNYLFNRTKGIMDDVYSTFNILKSKQKIRLSNDKWNPGDIWVNTSSMRVLPTFETLQEYNSFISSALQDGTLIGISLKKTKGKPKVLFVDQGSDKEYVSFKGIKKPKSVFNTGITVLTDNPKLSLNVRSFRTSTRSAITSELQLKGSAARHGKKTLSGYIKKYKIPQMTVKQIQSYEDDPQHLINMVTSLWKDNGYNFSERQIQKDWETRKSHGDDTVGYFRSIINSLQIGQFMMQNKGHANDIMSHIYLEASSMGEYSSDFIKVY